MAPLRLSLLTISLSAYILATTLLPSWAAGECSEEDETVSALQSAKLVGRSARMQAEGDDAKDSPSQSSGAGPTGDGAGVQIAVVYTAGAHSLCCRATTGKKPSECGLSNGLFTKSMAEAIAEGINSTAPQATVAIFDIGNECPTVKELSQYDAIIAGSPVWNGVPSPDLLSYFDDFPIRDVNNFLRCKIGAAFATGGGNYAGIQTTLEAIQRLFQTLQMTIVTGSAWQTGAGAAAPGLDGTLEEPGAYGGPVWRPEFLADARGLGARVGNLTSVMKLIPPLCGPFPGMVWDVPR